MDPIQLRIQWLPAVVGGGGSYPRDYIVRSVRLPTADFKNACCTFPRSLFLAFQQGVLKSFVNRFFPDILKENIFLFKLHSRYSNDVMAKCDFFCLVHL